MELYEEIGREYGHGAGSIRGVARKLGVHRREVRRALANAVPPERKTLFRIPSINGMAAASFVRSRSEQTAPIRRIVFGHDCDAR